jgi:hypothetical protein
MKTFNELQVGDTVYIRTLYPNLSITKEVHRTKVRQVIHEDEQVCKLTGINKSWIRYYLFEDAPRLFYRPDEGNVYAFHKFMHETHYYTDKQLLLEDLHTEQQQMSKKMNDLINNIKEL